MSVRLKRLRADHENMRRAFRSHPNIRIVEADGDPPERYKVEFKVKGVVVQDAKVVAKGAHLAEVYLPLGYPRQAPQCRMLTPVFHPNIAPHAICIGDHWGAGESLAALVARIGELITYQSYNVKSPLNGEAARWAEENVDRLPIQKVDLSVDVDAMTPAPPSEMPPPAPAPVPASVPAPVAEPAVTVLPEAPPAGVARPSGRISVIEGADFPMRSWGEAVRRELAADPRGNAVLEPLLQVVAALIRRQLGEARRVFGLLRRVKEASQLPQVHFLAGLIQTKLEQPEQALTSMRNAVTLDPGYAVAWHEAGVLAQRLGRADEAAEAMARHREILRQTRGTGVRRP